MRQSKNRAIGGVKRVDTKYTQFLAREEMGLLDFVMHKLDGISRTKAKAILTNGGVLVDHNVVTKHDFVIKPDMIVEISKHPGGTRKSFDYTPFFDIVYEDDDLIVVNKADEVLSMGVGRSSLNMKDLLDSYFVDTRQHCNAHVVHRLDARTTGLMMYAKSVEVQQMLTAEWHKTVVDRRYVAVVEGEMEQEEGHVKSWLKDTESLKIVSSRTNNGGKWSWTDWRLLKKKDGLSLIELHLHTGRKNQIRVHMSVIHHSIVGDYKYGAQMEGALRMCLHAYKLAFYHPRTQQILSFETPFPTYFTDFFKD
ncbi:MAG: pseudouridine synthase [Muribaculaceae bacterium]